jgi:hypothetical protein
VHTHYGRTQNIKPGKKGGIIMFTLVDFITHIKGVEYILSILAIGGFLLFWEVLKPKPFSTVISTGREDMEYIQQRGYGDVMKSVGKLAAAPFIGLAYLAMIPVGFAAALIIGTVNLALRGLGGILGTSMSFDWRPMEAYLAGKKNKKAKEK